MTSLKKIFYFFFEEVQNVIRKKLSWRPVNYVNLKWQFKFQAI